MLIKYNLIIITLSLIFFFFFFVVVESVWLFNKRENSLSYTSTRFGRFVYYYVLLSLLIIVGKNNRIFLFGGGGGGLKIGEWGGGRWGRIVYTQKHREGSIYTYRERERKRENAFVPLLPKEVDFFRVRRLGTSL